MSEDCSIMKQINCATLVERETTESRAQHSGCIHPSSLPFQGCWPAKGKKQHFANRRVLVARR
jgi:hypothetical protein